MLADICDFFRGLLLPCFFSPCAILPASLPSTQEYSDAPGLFFTPSQGIPHIAPTPLRFFKVCPIFAPSCALSGFFRPFVCYGPASCGADFYYSFSTPRFRVPTCFSFRCSFLMISQMISRNFIPDSKICPFLVPFKWGVDDHVW